MLQALDPDAGDDAQLAYSLAAESPYFDVELTSGRVFVASAAGLQAGLTQVQVKATDPRGLRATTTVEVSSQQRKLKKNFQEVGVLSGFKHKMNNFGVIFQLLNLKSRSLKFTSGNINKTD